MADTKVSALTLTSTVNTGDYILLVQGGSSVKIDIDTLFKNLPSKPVIKEASETLTTAGAISTALLVTKLSGAATYTLAAGTHGMEKQIVCTAAVAAIISVTSGSGVATITCNAAGDSVHLKNIDGLWYVLGSNSVTIA